MKPSYLRVEHLEEPLGIDVRQPRLSWWLPDGARNQIAYQIRAGSWDSGRVTSAQSVLVPYGGPRLCSRQRVDWMVRIWTDLGGTDWSFPASWEMGLVETSDWVGHWISPEEDSSVCEAPIHPAYLLRRDFVLASRPERARIYATAHGIYELFLNGQRVGDLELTPGSSAYQARLQVQTFDVTDLLQRGENTLSAVLSDGWFRGQNGSTRLTRLWGDHVALLAQLEASLEDGSVQTVGTDGAWRSAVGSIQSADLMEGQFVNFQVNPKAWRPVIARDLGLRHLCSSPAPPVRRVQEVRPISVRTTGPEQVVDLGQNINGWVRLSNLGPAGTTITLLHGEALDRHGRVTVENVLPLVVENLDVNDSQAIGQRELPSRVGRPFQLDRVTSDGESRRQFEPRHTTHGFRYVGVQGHPERLTPDDITGIVVHTDLRRTGWFQCNMERINQLHNAAVWSFRGNACDVPTDCPTRERAAWTGDWQIFVETAAFLYDVAGFSTKWLRDLAADQWPNGVVPHVVPDTMPMDAPTNVFPPGAAGWADAAVIVPWEIYRAYGDLRLLEEQWPSMTAWVDYAARTARDNRHASRIESNRDPLAHEQYLWDTGFHWGEWLEPGEFSFDPAKHLAADQGDVATAYLHNSARILGEVARLLSKDEKASAYSRLASATKHAWQAEFVRPDGKLSRDTQASYVRALAFNLVPDAMRPILARRLVELIRGAGTHLGTGFLSTPYLLPVLADEGHIDVAYELLFQESPPSWLAMIDRGATTIWELWDGADENGVPTGATGVNSLNHYSKGAVISFLHRYVAGIRIVDEAPAYRRFAIAPMPGGGLSTASATHNSPYGQIVSAWKIDREQFTLEVTVPAGTIADIAMPNGDRFEAGPGTNTYVCTWRRHGGN